MRQVVEGRVRKVTKAGGELEMTKDKWWNLIQKGEE